MTGQWYLPSGHRPRKPPSFVGGVALTVFLIFAANIIIMGAWVAAFAILTLAGAV